MGHLRPNTMFVCSFLSSYRIAMLVSVRGTDAVLNIEVLLYSRRFKEVGSGRYFEMIQSLGPSIIICLTSNDYTKLANLVITRCSRRGPLFCVTLV